MLYKWFVIAVVFLACSWIHFLPMSVRFVVIGAFAQKGINIPLTESVLSGACKPSLPRDFILPVQN